MFGTVRTICPVCVHDFYVTVSFEHAKPFNSRITKCPNCGEELIINDNHEFSYDGTIKELASLKEGGLIG